ncbi:DUF4097 family beta strand repeat-containing protein [Polymorphospora sp. NPDC051019]|uniref:DUF4097 family beta strand repeat-containing protein n=1 Tax=Polymorphospora sp. NPDC051019 TaxID=3155725 RepID=UPI00341C92A2
MNEFPRDTPVTVVVKLSAGALDIVAEERTTATVDVRPYADNEQSRTLAERTSVELRGDTLTVTTPHGAGLFRRSGGVRVEIRVPHHSAVRVKAASADVDCRGRYAAASVDTASGEIHVEHVTGDATLHSSSGDVTAARVDGRLTLTCSSGDLNAGYVGGEVVAKAASGDIDIREAMAGVHARNASGDVRIGAARSGTVDVGTTSGDIGVGVTAGTGVWLDVSTLSGTARNGLDMGAPVPPNGHQLSLALRSASGDIEVYRVAPAKTL